ncbi:MULTISPECIES: cytochrome c oxidase subunit 3 [Mesonia]|uniref:Cytochrome c oxidase subunit 3 n=1 Tax=Mesonia oceanica TaxID=2687242 RepID=A0AC61Y8E3_9FLAO|nr:MULTISPECIES: cytochrome c oxidase subunit 3 [Mesonia]MAN27415.1 cytochrome oxidase subunit III [Mesonia sp.]MAQ40310.1 cytochrome oxidase subunit III [Mesonia sp.]MBJ97221.1 cytochrome oxidase subunit III [Flavobacteriaceae bacterium]VVV00742.1 putative cytochrome c oxidase subunit 3 [Mesonia oceanica]|tara:strand:- start:27690 stop:28688 length:999 start_codon:yes stop_codon:yes gene_type:complete
MDATVARTGTEGKTWGGGSKSPLKASYGKMMMWYFITSDALTFSAFLAAYGFSRFKFLDEWPIADEVFNHFPFLHGVDAPMYYVALMTFILIFSSVTMVLAVDAGHQLKKGKVTTYLFLTIIGGLIFVGSQAWEWKNFIKGEHGAIETANGRILHFVNAEGERVSLKDVATPIEGVRTEHENNNGVWFLKEPSTMSSYSLEEVIKGFETKDDFLVRTHVLNEEEDHSKVRKVLSREESLEILKNNAVGVVEGANLTHNEYGPPLFADFFFFITGFHGFHVFTGVLINIIIFINVVLGTYEKRRSYEMVEKVGLYWHFVDLVWVFVFTFFYLV